MTARARLTLQGAIATMAAASALSAVFVDARWLFPVAGAVLLVALANEVCRRTPLPAALGPVLSAVVVLCYITWLDTPRTAYARVVPTRDSLSQLGDLARSGFTDIRALAAPVPTHRGLVLLAVVGIAAVELVVDLLAVTLRRAAVAGLPLLAVFALCTSVAKGGVGWLPFGIGTAGYLWLLLVDSRDRISRWGRSIGSATTSAARVTWADAELSPSPLSILGRRIGATAIAVAVVVPMVVPGLHGGLPKHGTGGGGSGRGSSQVVTVNPIVNIKAQLNSQVPAKLMRVVSTDFAPGYLRLTSLDLFDGTTFSPSDLKQPASANVHNGVKSPHVTGTEVHTAVSMDSLDVHWLPLPTQVESVSVHGDWRYDPDSNTVFSSRSDTHHLDYSATSVRFEPTAQQLESAGLAARGEVPERYISLPPNISDQVVSLAEAITSKATTPFDKAMAIQTFLSGPRFHYDTTVPATDSNDALAQFLLVTRRGFCQQFAASMAVLARMVGIPSRVAVGFTHGTLQSDGSWLITSHDAHAWPELYLSGYGWMPFEPTPRTDGQAIAPSYTRLGGTNQPNDTRSGTDGAGQQTKPKATSPADLKGLERDTSTPSLAHPAARHRTQSPWLWFALLGLLVALALLPGVSRAVQRRRRWHGGSGSVHWAHQGWAELRACAIDTQVGWLDDVTPRTTARLLRADGGLDADATAALDRLVRAEERARYAAAAGEVDRDEVRRDVNAVSRAMTARLSPLQRVGTVVWPRSTVAAARRVTSAFADVLDLADVAGVRVRRWLHRRVPRPA